jgi:bifunctional UDP-N-acetylglucosamine pyrophosphorylase/glucosamine-1-phosphate N-acetyltransferase
MAQTPVLIILAGGASSRMWPLREKSLLRFGSEPLLVSQLQRFKALGFNEAVIVANPDNHDDIVDMTAQMRAMNIETVVQTEPKGMGDAILQAATVLAARPETPIYITQVHDVVDDRLHQRMLEAFQANSGANYLAGYEYEGYFPGGYLIVDRSGRISGIIEKPGAENKPSNLVNIVAHIHRDSSHLFNAVRAEYAKTIPTDDHYERAMDNLMQTEQYQVVPYHGHWSALKYPWHVLDVMNHFLSQIEGQIIAKSASVADTARLVGNVFIGENVRVFAGASVVGPAYIGAGTIVGNNSLVRQSMVLNACEVGFTTEIARSYVADHCSMHACRVLDSVFAPNINFSAGCTTANLRIDRGSVQSTIKGQKMDTGRHKLGAIIGRDAFIGVDAMTMPGVKIGEGAQVGPGTHVMQDVKDRQRIYVKQEIEVVDADE